ncbi:MAG: TolC family protein [Thermodesulfovibrio sp.]|nr:TolC family protein [Thermodesulfovibrio sp.]
MKFLIVIVVIFFLIQTGFAQKNYTIQDIFSVALKKAEKVKIAEENIKIAEEGRYKALSHLLPTITAFSKYTEYSKEKLVTTPTAIQIIQPSRTTLWGITVEERISLGGKEFIALSIAKENINKTEFNVISFKEQYLLKVAQELYSYLKAKRAVEIAQANVERLKKHRDAAKIRLKVGEVTKTDLLRAEAELSGAEADLISTINNLKIAKLNLTKVAGISEDFEVIETKLIDPYIDLTVENIKDIAKQHRAEIKVVQAEKEIAKKNVNHAISSFFPYVSISVTYQRLDQNPSNQFTNKESSYLVAALNFPIFEGGLRKAEVGEAKAKLRQAELMYEDILKEVLVDVESAYLLYVTFKDTIKSLEDEVAYAKENFNSVFKQYQHGLANSIDVTDANTFLLTAERRLMEAQYNYQLAILRLRQATGTLLKAFLNNEILLKNDSKQH